MIRDAYPFQNGWIFGKVPNSLWPPPSFSESYIANFLNWLRSLQKMEPIELPSWKCTLFWFLSIQLLKNITWKDPFGKGPVKSVPCSKFNDNKCWLFTTTLGRCVTCDWLAAVMTSLAEVSIRRHAVVGSRPLSSLYWRQHWQQLSG